MDTQNSSRPLAADERSAVAVLLEAAHAALMNEAIPYGKGNVALGFIAHALERGALDVRRGHRAGDLRTVARDLERRIRQLATGTTIT
jgi:hypothetical protein